jgi:ribokinase
VGGRPVVQDRLSHRADLGGGAGKIQVAVVGHVEWVRFAVVDAVPRPGEIVDARETFEEPAGGGGVAAVQLARLAGACTLYTALGEDGLGHRAARELRRHGVRVETTFRDTPQRQAFTFLDAGGERTVTVFGERLGPHGSDPLPWDELAGTKAVYFTAGDLDALRQARRARVLVATARMLPLLAEAGVPVDALVRSGRDRAERYEPGVLDPPPRFAVTTAGARGGTWEAAHGRTGSWEPAPLPGPVVDTFGCGDSFAAGLAFGLAANGDIQGAVDLGARCGAHCLTGRGPYSGQLRLDGEPT